MAVNWSAYEAAKEIYGENRENIADIGSRFPLFTRTVSMANSEFLLDILAALPKVTARVVETGLKDLESNGETEEDVVEEEPKKENKKAGKPKKAEKEEAEDDWTEEDEEETNTEESNDYESMTAKELYALCCQRGISSKCKDRKKTTLIKLLKETDGASETASEDDWEDEEEAPKKPEKDPYKGKTAKELYMMCKERGIAAKSKKEAEEYAKLLKKADEAAQDEEQEDDDDWEI